VEFETHPGWSAGVLVSKEFFLILDIRTLRFKSGKIK